MRAAAIPSRVGDALGAATDALAAAGVDSPRLDAELLLEAATGLERSVIAAEPATAIEPRAGRSFAGMVRRRLRREPVAYILGRKGFRQIELRVDRRVLIPRPETELLVEVALELRPASVLDVGTGSGAVALAIADELPDARVTATDTSPGALDLAVENAARLRLSDRVQVRRGTVPAGERFDLVVANLPYVSERDWEGLQPEIHRHEPRDALVAGPTGLEAIEALIDGLDRRGGRHPASAVAIEVGAAQAGAVEELVGGSGFEQTERRRDLAGIERVVIGR